RAGYLSRLRGRSSRSTERGGWGKTYQLDHRVLWKRPHPNPPPQAGEGARFRRSYQLDLITLRLALFRTRRIQRQIQRQYVNAGFAEQSGKAAFGVLGDQLTETIFRDLARLGHARHLEQRALRRNIRIEPAAGSGDEIDWNGDGRILGLQLVDILLDPVVQRLAGRAEVGAARIGGVIGRRHRLGGIGRVRRGRSGGTAMEIFLVLEFLPDQG